MKRAWDAISSGTDMVARLLEITEKAESLNILKDEDKMETLRSKLQELSDIKADMIEELQTAELRSGKKPRNELQNWFINVARVKVEVQRLEQEVEQGGLRSKLLGKLVEKKIQEVKELIDQSARFQERLLLDVHANVGVALLVPKLVGQEFEMNKGKIWECLMEDEGLIISIFGMGGVGKTTLVTHVHNELLQRQKNVYWITVSQDFGIGKLQNLIAKAIGVDISREDEEKKKAALLWNALSRKKKFVLILDDLWEHFSLKMVGIPISRENGCKVIVTSRSLEVCNRMDCNKKIKVKPLSEEEAWNLFQEKLGEQLRTDVKKIAKHIARECAGLPLGIITMAGCMKGVEDVSEWRNTLREMQESKVNEGDMETLVFRILKFSYYRLGNLALQNCFLYCALYPEDHKVWREEFINYLIDEGVIEERSRQAEFDKGHTMLNKLEKVCLLEGVQDDRDHSCVKMHDLIRDMAIQLMNADTLVMAGKVCTVREHWGTSNVLDCKSWTENLVRISLMYDSITEIPSNNSPMCPKLASLLLGHAKLERIADPFFEHLPRLKILDLSYTDITKLPDSVSNLSNLRTLLLRRCSRLRRVPPLLKLKALIKLDLNFSGVEGVPEGMKFLSNLKYLGLLGTKVRKLPQGILPKLSSLQVLLLDPGLTVKGKEIASLKKLESLCCRLYDFNEFNKYFRSSEEGHGLSLRNREVRSLQLNNYFLWIGREYDLPVIGDKIFNHQKEPEFVLGKRVILGSYSIIREDVPLEFKLLELQSYQTGRWLCLENESALKELKIYSCVGVQYLFSLCSSFVLKRLEKIQVTNSMDIHALLCTTPPATTSPFLPPKSNGIFCLLKRFEISRCPSMRKLFTPWLLSNLRNLEELYVGDCENMEEVITLEEQNESHDNNFRSSFTLPKLRHLELVGLRELKSICSRKMICDSLQLICIAYCPKLKTIPLSLLLKKDKKSPLPSLQRIGIVPKKWWDLVELDHPEAKNIVSPLLKFILH